MLHICEFSNDDREYKYKNFKNMSAQQENDTKESTIARINKTIDVMFAVNICVKHEL